MAPSRSRLWAPSDPGASTDACNVQHGAAGVLAVLVRAAQLHEQVGLADSVRTAADWIDERLDAVPRLLPGLYYDRSGTAWALWDAAAFLDDPALQVRAVDLAGRLPIADWGNPDIAHGLAGAGLAYLHLWHSAGLDSARPDGLRQRGRRGRGGTDAEPGCAHRLRRRLVAGRPGQDAGEPSLQHWCSGASGIGTFLIRLWHVTGTAAC